jgi:hypothetical protein
MAKKPTTEYECDECGEVRSTDPNHFRSFKGDIVDASGKLVSQRKQEDDERDWIYCGACSLKIKLGIFFNIDYATKKHTVYFRKG